MNVQDYTLSLETNKSCFVNEKWCFVDGTWRGCWSWNLVARGIDISSTVCPLCEVEEETMQHRFVNCRFVKVVWVKLFSWWKLKPPDHISYVVWHL